MRPSLLHTRDERRDSRRQRHRRAARTGESAAQPCDPAAQPCEPAAPPRDPAVQRVREAGGPVDRASYTCACGYLFSAAVSTTVACPHCGADQAW
jgi:hypothetical protein